MDNIVQKYENVPKNKTVPIPNKSKIKKDSKRKKITKTIYHETLQSRGMAKKSITNTKCK